MSNEVEIVVKARDQSGPAFDSARGRAKQLGSEGGSAIGGFSEKIKGMGAAAAAAAAVIAIELAKKAIGALIDYAKGGIAAASDLNESINAVNVVFKDSAKQITDWGKTQANAYGLSQRAFQEMATPLGALLKNQGVAQKDLAQTTIELTKRAADLASVFNTTVPDALDALTAGLRGETDPLERYGVSLTAAAVEAEALAETGKKTTASLTDQEKATARLNLIMKQTDDSAGDFKNTSDGLANSSRILAARQEELQAQLGQKLLPAMQKLNEIKLAALEYLANTVFPAVAAGAKIVIEKFDYVWQQAAPKLRDLLDVVKQKWDENKDSIAKLKPLLEYLGVFLGVTLVAALIAVGGLIGLFIEYLGRVGDTLQSSKKGFDSFVISILTMFGRIIDGAAAAFGWIPGIGPKIEAARNKFHSATDGILNDLKKAQQAATSGINVAIRVTGLGNLSAASHAIANLVGSSVVSVGLGHRAAGGISGGLTEVGEHGRELVRLPTGSMVYPEANANQMSARSNGSGPVEIIFGSDGSAFGDFLLEAVSNAVRVRGGDRALLNIRN